jgi:putative transcriptional regulator
MAKYSGKLLVASPKLDGTMFAKTVVYLYDHGRQGSQGLVINRPSEETKIADLLDNPLLNSSLTLQEFIFHGGPVAERTITMLHTGEWFSANTRVVSEDFSLSSDQFMLEKISSGNTPRQWLMAAGKCGWIAGQLENEIDKHAWLPLTAKPSIVFSSGQESLWKLCIELCASESVESWF